MRFRLVMWKRFLQENINYSILKWALNSILLIKNCKIMRRLSEIRMNLKANKILSESEMKRVKGGIECYRSGTDKSFTTDSNEVAAAWMLVWDSLGQDVRCFG